MSRPTGDAPIQPTFLQFWQQLNAQLTARSEPEALHDEARYWWSYRHIKRVDARLVNRVVNARKPK